MDARTIERHGTPGGPLAIALHGAVVNRKTWLPLAHALPPEIELWAPDLPGHGARRDEPFTLAAALDTVDALLALARPRRVVLAGDSLGGYVALAAAERTPHGLLGVVAGGCTWSLHGINGWPARLTDVPLRAFAGIFGTARADALAASVVPLLTDDVTAHAVVSGGLRSEARTESLREIGHLDLLRIVRAIRVPIAFVNGAWDWATRGGEGALLRAARDATLTLAPHAGHGVGLLAPDVFAQAIVALAERDAEAT